MIESEGFKEIESLVGVDTNASKTEQYDRLFLSQIDSYFQVARDSAGSEIGGVFDPFQYVFKHENRKTYKTEMKKVYGGSGNLDDDVQLEKYFRDYWRKNQLSDHFPIWFELVIDSSNEFLDDKLTALG